MTSFIKALYGTDEPSVSQIAEMVVQAQKTTCFDPPQRREWMDEAQKAIHAVDASSPAVVDAMRGYARKGLPPPSLYARLEDGSQWVVDEGKARKLSDSEIVERDARLATYHFGD